MLQSPWLRNLPRSVQQNRDVVTFSVRFQSDSSEMKSPYSCLVELDFSIERLHYKRNVMHSTVLTNIKYIKFMSCVLNSYLFWHKVVGKIVMEINYDGVSHNILLYHAQLHILEKFVVIIGFQRALPFRGCFIKQICKKVNRELGDK